MSDAAFKTARYPGMTTVRLQQAVANGNDGYGYIAAEIERRRKVAAGDTSVMTDGERLRFVRAASKASRPV